MPNPTLTPEILHAVCRGLGLQLAGEEQEENAMSRMDTFTGRRFNPMNPDPSHVSIEDIAHHLGNQCRFNGACRVFYSVAEHCWHCSRLSDNPMEALLHDAHEAYLGDIISPIKWELAPEWGEIEYGVQLAIWEALGVPEPVAHIETEVSRVDRQMLGIEARELLTTQGSGWAPEPTRVVDRLPCWCPEVAAQNFLERYSTIREAL